MELHSLSTSFFWIFSGAALIASLALLTKQPLLIAYIALGALIGPFGFQLVENVTVLGEISHIGIIFLLFLIGLDMQPKSMLAVLKPACSVAFCSSLIFALCSFLLALLFQFNHIEAVIIAIAMVFSSTIVGIKLLPTTALHHKRSGEFMIGILLFQDLLAILVLLGLMSDQDNLLRSFSITIFLILPAFVMFSWGFVKYVLFYLLKRFDRFHEYIFLLALGWCLGMARLSELIGLSSEIGAFIAGVALATSPISPFIAMSLKPLRDFFLILFFFALGAQFDLTLVASIIWPAMGMAVLLLILKPVIFHYLMQAFKEEEALSWDVGFRLGQASEFSLLIAYVAFSSAFITKEVSHFIQATTIITFIISSYLVVFNFPSPIAASSKLRRD